MPQSSVTHILHSHDISIMQSKMEHTFLVAEAYLYLALCHCPILLTLLSVLNDPNHFEKSKSHH